MIYLEAYLLTILVFLLIGASVSDFRTGRIPNKSIMICIALGILALVPYYAIYAKDCFISYVVNNSLAIGIGLILYSSGIWGAGDCKLLCAAVALYPSRLYCANNRSVASCFLLIVFVFVAAFLYVVGDTVYLGIKQKNLFRLARIKLDLLAYLRSFLFFFFLLNLWNAVFSLVATELILEDVVLTTALHFILLLLAMKIEQKVSGAIVGAMGIVWMILILLRFTHFSISGINWKIYMVIILQILFRSSAEKYNYKAIHVSELKPGMILSIASVMRFSDSKVQGLPTFSSEDLKSRLSVVEVESIKRWSRAKSGRDTLIIVRKIPFALFIAIGTLAFTVLEVLIQ